MQRIHCIPLLEVTQRDVVKNFPKVKTETYYFNSFQEDIVSLGNEQQWYKFEEM